MFDLILLFYLLLVSLWLWAKWILFLLFIPYLRKKGKLEFCEIEKERNISMDLTPKAISSTKGNFFKNQIKKIKLYRTGFIRYMSFQVGLIPSHRIRKFIYKHVFMVKIANNVTIYWDCEMRSPGKLSIGKGSIIGDHAVLDARRGGIEIGENVNISNSVSMWTGQHDYNDPYFRSVPGRRGPIIIKNRVWIGPNVTILHSVTIGEGAVIAAGAVVTKDVPPFTLVGGVPAKIIGSRNNDLRYEFSGDHIPFY